MFGKVSQLFGGSAAEPRSRDQAIPCVPNAHMRDAGAVFHTGGALRAPCTRCGCVLVRKHNGWRPALPLRLWSDLELGAAHGIAA